MRAWILLSLGLAACSDYKLNPDVEDPATGTPDVEVTPSAIAETVCAPPLTAEVTVRNAGDAVLTVTNLVVDGAGWSFPAVPLPLTLDPGASTVLPVTGTEGSATLYVVTDDPDEGTVTVPLTLTANAPPTVTIDDPTDGTVYAEGADATLTGTVADDVDAPEALALSWSSAASGVLSTSPADPTGLTSVPWPAADRPAGPDVVTLTATDSCGLSTTASTGVCHDGAYTYEALDLASWHYEGTAGFDSADGWLQLTDPGPDEVGSAFETSSPIAGDDVQIDFLFYIGGGTGADGLSLTALDTERMTSFLGGTGCGMGFGGDAACTSGPALPGWSIEVDTYYNSDADPTDADHVAFMFDGDADEPQAWAALPEMEDTGWHHLVVRVAEPHVTVAIDDIVYIDQDIVGYYEFPAYVGYTAGTGSLTNFHLIDSLLVTDYLCE